jgi:BirA family biotin operon repressor/biotin-[acetyl-CoA-carboxylase] ligase
MTENPAFSPRVFQGALQTECIGRFIVYRPVTETTMTLARREAEEGAPHGTLVLAEEQTAGRGRRGRSFYSPAGENLYFTLILRLDLDSHSRLPVAIPVAVCAACREEGVDARIKWPNDIWIGERKLCGMLIDAELTPQGGVAFPGVGINVNGDPTVNPELRGVATSLRLELGRTTARELLLARICNGVEEALVLETGALLARYRELSMILGRRVTVIPAAGAPFHALAHSIAANGSLMVRRDDGSDETVAAADVSLRSLALPSA